jgi:hypothetical protein
MAKVTYYATYNGETYTRTTARTYTHAAVYSNGNGVFVGSFHSSADLAAKGSCGSRLRPIAVVEVRTTAEVPEVAEVAEVPAQQDECPNSGVLNARKIKSGCVDCGKYGTVNRRTGTLRAHAPAELRESAGLDWEQDGDAVRGWFYGRGFKVVGPAGSVYLYTGRFSEGLIAVARFKNHKAAQAYAEAYYGA